jgi:hypothetical protein
VDLFPYGLRCVKSLAGSFLDCGVGRVFFGLLSVCVDAACVVFWRVLF